MKNLTKLLYLALIFLASNTFAQAPQRMSYQAIVRDDLGNLVTNQNVSMRVSILQGSVSGTTSYSETHSTSTNNNGLVTIEIGGGLPITGTFSAINWSTGTYFIKTETDPTGGSNYTIVGTSQLLSVPYALYAETTKSLGKTTIYLVGDITNAEAIAKIAKDLGPNTENIYIKDTTTLTSVDLSAATSLVNLFIQYNPFLSQINLSGLTTVDDRINIRDNPALNSLDFPAYTKGSALIEIINNDNLTSIAFPNYTNSYYAVGISENAALTTVSFPSLTTVKNNITITDNPNITSLSLAALTSLGDISFRNSSLTSLSMPNLTKGKISITNHPTLTSIDFPVLNNALGGINISENSNLTAIQLPQLAVFEAQSSGISFTIKKNKLPSSQINYLLNKLLTVTPSSGKSIDLKLQSPLAPPTGQGLIDKATLISAGNSVLTD